MTKAITIKDIAKDAGVCIKTVSRVINNYPHVSEDIRKRVWQSVDAFGYVPNEMGKRLALRKSGHPVRNGDIGCILFSNYEKYSEPYTAEILDELDRVLLEMGIRNHFTYTLDELADQSLFINTVNPNIIGGCLLIGLSDQHMTEVDRIRKKVKCLVLLGRVEDNTVSCVHPDGFMGGFLATNYLINMGHRRIGCIVGYLKEHSDTKLRFNGYKKALEAAGIPYDDTLVKEGRFSIEGAVKATDSLLKTDTLPTAIYSVSDPMSIGVYKAIQERGLRIPRDISVISFDNINLASHLYPSLTTIGMDKKEMVKMALQVLISEMEGKGTPGIKITFPVELVERQSCRKLV
ncbi:MAG: LacI family DNA-binding transcriptional regulator [bacterium]|jgi:LacI family transcriptional regulator|nr:LacI family DNA-binding transcriptional regulator [bacterium]MDD3806024.1 LacI family DNA-binding transcriptional regulator [bacterium]MDD4558111.1 LacI family DNA-binding transcriptional regulator [bacterium]